MSTVQRSPLRSIIITRAIVFLLLGAIINVAVAIGGSLTIDGPAFHFGRVFESDDGPSESALALWERHVSDGWPARPLYEEISHGPLVSQWRLRGGASMGSWWVPINATRAQLRDVYRGSGDYEVEQVDCGFPFGTLRLEKWKGNPMMGGLFPTTAGDDGLVLGGVSLPRHILVVTAALNTLFYAGIVWPLSAVPVALLRRLRVRRGLCPACAYPVGTSGVCTECGEPLAKHKAQTQKAQMP